MKLTEFIHSHHHEIIDNWVEFAKTMTPWSAGLSETSLRDHASELLTAVVMDMDSPQSAVEQEEKSKGHSEDGLLALIGQRHAADRLESGLDLDQLVSEFRALRASVLRLWESEQHGENEEMTRFNEAIDETLAESASRYTRSVEKTRDQFLGILGHDLRNPLGAILMGASLLSDSEDPETLEVAKVIKNSAERMNRMVDDLLDLTRTRLGNGIPINCKAMVLNQATENVISELRTFHPETEFRIEEKGDLSGNWDCDRLAQVISNLLSNAVQYGADSTPITLHAEGFGDKVVIKIHNEGHPIAPAAMKTIFTPMVRTEREGQAVDKNKGGLGLGLYIAFEIVSSHKGTVTVSSTRAEGTTFTVTLPRIVESRGADFSASEDDAFQRRTSPEEARLQHS